MSGRTFEEIDRLAREASFGKGQHEKPFIGREEHMDPTTIGNKIGVPVEKEGLDLASASNDEAGASRTNPLDKFRSRGKRAPHSTTKIGGR